MFEILGDILLEFFSWLTKRKNYLRDSCRALKLTVWIILVSLLILLTLAIVLFVEFGR